MSSTLFIKPNTSPGPDSFQTNIENLRNQIEQAQRYLFEQDLGFRIFEVVKRYDYPEIKFVINLNNTIHISDNLGIPFGYWFDYQNKDKKIEFTNFTRKSGVKKQTELANRIHAQNRKNMLQDLHRVCNFITDDYSGQTFWLHYALEKMSGQVFAPDLAQINALIMEPQHYTQWLANYEAHMLSSSISPAFSSDKPQHKI